MVKILIEKTCILVCLMRNLKTLAPIIYIFIARACTDNWSIILSVDKRGFKDYTNDKDFSFSL